MFKECAVQIAKATLFAVIFSMVYVLLFSFIIQLAQLSSSVIKPINQVFKIVAVALGVMFFVRGQKGYLKGAFSGVFATLICHLIFAVIGGSFTFELKLLLEIIICAVSGLVAGIIAVNVKRT